MRHYLTLARAVLVAAVLASPPLSRPARADELSRVTLSGQRVALDLSSGRPLMRFDVVVHNRLAVPLAGVEVGWLFAASEEAVKRVQSPGPLYLAPGDPRRLAAPPDLGVIRKRLTFSVAPGQQTPATFSVPVAEGAAEPTVFVTHILGYDVAQAPPSLLLDLLATDAAADERAAVRFLGLAGGVGDKLAARRRLGSESGFVQAFADLAAAAIPAQPSREQTLQRVYAVLALGVLGGPVATQTLSELSQRAELAAFDEPFKVLLVSRLVHSMLDTPLAFSVPREARTMGDVVRAALADTALADAGEGGQAQEPDLVVNGLAVAPGAGLPITGSAGAGSAGTGSRGTGSPGAGSPGAGSPGAGSPGAGLPGTGSPGTGLPGTGSPGTGSPGTGSPGTGLPEAGLPGTGLLGAGSPETGAASGSAESETSPSGGVLAAVLLMAAALAGLVVALSRARRRSGS